MSLGNLCSVFVLTLPRAAFRCLDFLSPVFLPQKSEDGIFPLTIYGYDLRDEVVGVVQHS